LTGFAADFDADREWRFGLFALDADAVLGEVSLFPRSATGRVPLADADRVEIGYWLRADRTGHGLVTEAARAVLDVVSDMPRFSQVEIRCDARNEASAAIPRRLGFELATTVVDSAVRAVDPPVHLQVWTLQLSHSGRTTGVS
jgi:RimJ/RimL family protein N-acetyltransferase